MESVPEVSSGIAESDGEARLASLGESEEEYLRASWEKLGVGQDGYLDQTQLALVCECIGMEKLTDEVVAQLFDKLDLDRDGRISFGEFLHLFQNVRPGKAESSDESPVYEHNEWRDDHTRISGSVRAESTTLTRPGIGPFLTIDSESTGFSSFETTAEFLRSLGVPQASILLSALNFRPSAAVNLVELAAALHEEMNAALESGMLSRSGHAGLALHAAVLLTQHELCSMRLAVDHTSRECDKLRSDLQEANHRASLLAQEVDENHAKQEAIRRSQLKQLEQRHADQLRMANEVAQAERDQLVSKLQRELDKRHQQLVQAKEEEVRLKESVQLTKEDNCRLAAENAQLNEQITSTERANGRLMRELDGVSLMAELESRCELVEESQRHSLTEQLNRLSAENLQLRDRNDELSAQVEILRGKLAVSRTEIGRLGSQTAWRSEPTMSGAVKRRNESDEEQVPWMENSMNVIGKMRRKDLLESFFASPEQSPRSAFRCETVTNLDRRQSEREVYLVGDHDESLAAQLQQVKQADCTSAAQSAACGSTAWQLGLVMDQLRSQFGDKSVRMDDIAAVLQRELNVQDCSSQLSHVQAQLAQVQNRCDDLLQLQKVMEAEHEMQLNDLRHQLNKSAHSADDNHEDYEHLTEALADLDAALEKEFEKLQGDDRHQDDDQNTKVEKLEMQCQSLVNELDCVKEEIVKIVLENEELRILAAKFEDELETERREGSQRVEEKVHFETALLQQRIKQLTREIDEGKQQQETERIASEEDRKDLESRLELLRTEYDRLDDYWQLKMDEERDLYEQERLTTDEKFLALESKIKEYEDLLSQGDNLSSSSSLSTIEERANWEKQLTDAEEECQSLRQSVTDLQRRLAQMERDHDEAVSKMSDEREHLVGRVRNLEKSFQERREEEEEQENLMKINNQLVSTVKIVGSPRPVSPVAKPAILPSGYSPLKSKGWARTCRSVPVSPGKCSGSPPEAHNKYQICGPSSLNVVYHAEQQQQQKACRVDISVLQSLNTRLKQQEQRCRELQLTLAHQKRRCEQIMLESKIQHEEEINSLEDMMRLTQETLHQMMVKHQQAMEKLTASDTLIMELYTENSHLLRALHLQSLTSSASSSSVAM